MHEGRCINERVSVRCVRVCEQTNIVCVWGGRGGMDVFEGVCVWMCVCECLRAHARARMCVRACACVRARA